MQHPRIVTKKTHLHERESERLSLLSKEKDEDLMMAYKRGDELAFETLVKRHQKGIFNFLYRFLGNKQNVQEAFQEVFVRVIRSADSYEPTAKFTTWLYTIARNFCIDCGRREKYRGRVNWKGPHKEEEGDGVSFIETFSDGGRAPDEIASSQDLTKKLEMALAKINSDQREVFLLREKIGLSFEEVAKIVGSSVNTVKSRMRYALMALREELIKLGVLRP